MLFRFILFVTLFAHNVSAKITIMPFAEVPNLSINISDEETDLKDISYRPNTRSHLGLNLQYDWFSIGGSFKLGKSENNEEVDIDTKYFDFKGEFVLEKWRYGYSYQHYQGFYLDENPYEFTTIERPDIEAININFYGLMSINYKKLNLKDVFTVDKVDIKSDGSWITKILYSYSVIESVDPLTENFNNNSYKSINGLNYLNQSSLTNLWGYGYLHTTNSIKLYGEILFGIGPQWLRMNKTSGSFKNLIIGKAASVSFLISSNSKNNNYGFKAESY